MYECIVKALRISKGLYLYNPYLIFNVDRIISLNALILEYVFLIERFFHQWMLY